MQDRVQDRLIQSWRDTVAVLGRQMGITTDELKAGWPDSFKPERIAVLQRPYKWWPLKDREYEKSVLCKAYEDGLNAAVASGALVSITKTEQVVTDHKEKFEGLDYSDPFVRRNVYGEREFKPKYSSIPVYGDKEFTHITAPAFAAWLAAQRDNTPSPHIQAWFDAVGVAGAADLDTLPKPLQRTAAQAAAILHELDKQGYDPLALPKNLPGKPGVKAAIRAAIDGKGLFVGKTVFDKSWDSLRACGDIIDKD